MPIDVAAGEHEVSPHIDELADIERHVLHALANTRRHARELNGFGHSKYQWDIPKMTRASAPLS